MRFIKFNIGILLLLIYILLCSYDVTSPSVYNSKYECFIKSDEVDIFFEGDTNYASELFQSKLPLIIMDDFDKDSHGIIQVVDNAGSNNLYSTPAFTSEINFNILYDEKHNIGTKMDYCFSLIGNSADLLGIGSGNRWFLLGGKYDKSLIRNYLGYTLASLVLEKTPKVRFCELLIKEPLGYRYEGVYLLVEGNYGDNTFTFRRTQQYSNKLALDVVADKYVGLFISDDTFEKASQSLVESAGNAIDEVSNMFYSEDSNHFLKYSKIINKEYFYAYFIINELLCNYANMYDGVYSYNLQDDKLYIGPFFNFEYALDNQKNEFINVKSIKFQNAPFYRFMIQDIEFLNGLIAASKSIFNTLNSDKLSEIIDLAVIELGQAQQRDWKRWDSFYFDDANALNPYPQSFEDRTNVTTTNNLHLNDNGELIIEVDDDKQMPSRLPMRIRQFKSYEQEIIKLKYYTHTRPTYIKKAVTLLKNQKNLLSRVNAYGLNTLLTIVFFSILTLSIIFVRKTLEK